MNTKSFENPSTNRHIITIYTDGGSRGNPGEAAYGFVVCQDGKELYKEGKRLGINTNNFAEYSAVIHALKHITRSRQHVASIIFFLDSKLVVEQLTGHWKIKSESIRSLYHTVKTFELSLGIPITYKHIPREKNKEADRMVNLALDNLL